MPRKAIGELTLGDFLAVKTKINDSLKELKVSAYLNRYFVEVSYN